MSHDVLLEQDMDEAWRICDLVLTKPKIFSAAFIVCFIFVKVDWGSILLSMNLCVTAFFILFLVHVNEQQILTWQPIQANDDKLGKKRWLPYLCKN